jgi:curved DNA-binding protein CbpA
MYQKLALLLHPDRGGPHEAMILINELAELVTRDHF